jgi:hypothetical protein
VGLLGCATEWLGPVLADVKEPDDLTDEPPHDTARVAKKGYPGTPSTVK